MSIKEPNKYQNIYAGETNISDNSEIRDDNDNRDIDDMTKLAGTVTALAFLKNMKE